MGFMGNKVEGTTLRKNGARFVVVASILSTGILASGAVSAAGLGGGAWVSLEGLDSSATFVSFGDSAEGNSGWPAVPQDLSVLLAQVENVLGDEVAVPAVPVSPQEIQILVTEAQALVGPIMGAMGGGTMPNLAGLSLGELPLNGFGASGGGAPLALPGLDGLDAALPTGSLGSTLDGPLADPLGGALGGVGGLIDGVGGGLPVGGAVDGALGGVGGLLGQ